MVVAAKLQQGVAVDRILEDIRNSVERHLRPEHLMTRKDIQNIKVQFNINSAMKHKNDLLSVSSWVNEMQQLEYNPVIIFKQQGVPDATHNLDKNDFILGVQTEFQKDVFAKFGNSTICLDSTHGTYIYDFYLTTIVVVDEYGEGIPVAWCLSNRIDMLVLSEFLKALKCRAAFLLLSF